MKPFKILILDDDPIYGKVIQKILEYSDHDIELILAENGFEALKRVNEETPDLILTDWDMPGMSGIDFCKMIHKNKEFEHIPVIMCTGINTSSEHLKIAFESGVVDFIRKPIDKMEFLSRVNSMLKLSESYQTIKQQKEELQREKKKSDELLLSILPKKIAEDLKQSGKSEPELFKNVTVFFSDIVDFTKHASRIKPKNLIRELNEIVRAFDEIMEKHHCERIKTVGDGYVAVCGMPEANPNHAVNIIHAAQEIIQYLTNRNKKCKYNWKVRIGIASGELVGGIIGSRKYIYDVFGDTINTASRLESYSDPMRIHLSESTYKLAKNKFKFEEQIPVNVKGKGKMKMYFLKTSD